MSARVDPDHRRSWKERIGRGRMRLGALVAVGLAVAFLVWLLLSADDGAETPEGSGGAGAPRALSAAELAATARSTERPVYWAGPRAGVRYELTLTPTGRAFVRYLPPGVEAGDPRPDFLTVATYPLADALSAVRRAASRPGMRSERLPGGGLVVTARGGSTSAFFAEPDANAQVEVYAPTPGEALGLVLGDVIKPVR
jgi:hypothetical protein